MSIRLLYWLSFLIPIVIVPLFLPMVALMAHRKRLIDSPNERKLQRFPVAVMGGTVIVIALATAFIFVNLFYDISNLFPALCVIVILYTLGLIDDAIELSWQFKMVAMIISILLLYFGGDYGVHYINGLFFHGELGHVWSLIITLFFGLLILNAVNFIDGIDGLATGMGIMVAAVLCCWNVLHGFTQHAFFSFTMLGAMSIFFLYNVFSERCKMYLGDSGSLVLGLFIFLSSCQNVLLEDSSSFLVDRYELSFTVALLSEMLFDIIRVVVMRLFKGNSPFLPDRNHLHHVYVDMGMGHFMATTVLVLSNVIVLGVWLLTAFMELPFALQFGCVLLTGVLLYWLPYFHIVFLRDKRPQRYSTHSFHLKQVNKGFESVEKVMCRIIDRRIGPFQKPSGR